MFSGDQDSRAEVTKLTSHTVSVAHTSCPLAFQSFCRRALVTTALHKRRVKIVRSLNVHVSSGTLAVHSCSQLGDHSPKLPTCCHQLPSLRAHLLAQKTHQRGPQRSPAPSTKNVAADSHRAQNKTCAAAIFTARSVKRSYYGIVIILHRSEGPHSCAIVARFQKDVTHEGCPAQRHLEPTSLSFPSEVLQRKRLRHCEVGLRASTRHFFLRKPRVLQPVPTRTCTVDGRDHDFGASASHPGVGPARQFRRVLLESS